MVVKKVSKVKENKKIKQDSNGYGISGLVLGIGSIIFSWVPIFGLVVGIIGLIFSIKQRGLSPNNIATAGFATSIIGIVLSLVCLIWMIFGVLIIFKLVSLLYP